MKNKKETEGYSTWAAREPAYGKAWKAWYKARPIRMCKCGKPLHQAFGYLACVKGVGCVGM